MSLQYRTDGLCISITDGEWIYTSSIRPRYIVDSLFYLCQLIRIVHTDDETSYHERKGSYNETMRAVWINEGYVMHYFLLSIHHCGINIFNFRNKIEPAQASQFITKTIQAHFLGPIRRFSDFSMDVQNLLYDMFMESYSRGMEERYRDDSQHLELDHDIWIAASGAPKKGHVYGFGHSLGTARVISFCSSSVSHATSLFSTPAAPGGSSSAAPTMTLAQFREIIN
ncbi:hypothetical protein Taro_045433 [Colocasia esculenta]|uniref:Uncharacterized protein n=1 Tax=Colocasia esculenta TaxID=4460 RepID=A0A843X4T3_COLES|nr:hypothetical protein [Colocasia esculenta]